jgi:hypothetical protein
MIQEGSDMGNERHGTRVMHPLLLLLVTDAVHCPGLIVRDQESAIGHHLDVDGAPRPARLQPAFGKDLVL